MAEEAAAGEGGRAREGVEERGYAESRVCPLAEWCQASGLRAQAPGPGLSTEAGEAQRC